MNPEKKRAGFTLVEIIVVLVILAILAAIMIPSMTGWIDKAQKKQAYAELHAVAMAARSAYAEVYALHPNMSGELGFVTSGGKPTSTDGAAGSSFYALFSDYLSDAEMLANTTGIMFVGDQYEYLYITYRKGDTVYSYSSEDGKVTITDRAA